MAMLTLKWHIGDVIHKIRTLRGTPPSAHALGIKRASDLSELELGKGNPTRKKLQRVADALSAYLEESITVDDLHALVPLSRTQVTSAVTPDLDDPARVRNDREKAWLDLHRALDPSDWGMVEDFARRLTKGGVRSAERDHSNDRDHHSDSGPTQRRHGDLPEHDYRQARRESR
jgi:hypothetical protein